MAKKSQDSTPEVIYCACGCGEIVPRARYPSQQRRYLNLHQHRGEHNGNYRGGKEKRCCPICMKEFETWPTHDQRTCGSEECYRQWQRLVTEARGQKKIAVQCVHCGTTLWRYPSQVHVRNYCNRVCQAADNPRNGGINGNWRGGRWKFIRDQVLIRDQHRCVLCGFDVQVHVHHITPVKDGGTNQLSNLITLCPNHHAMADIGMLELETYRNFTWTPADTIAPENLLPKKRQTRKERPSRLESLYPHSRSIRHALGLPRPGEELQPPLIETIATDD